MERHRCKICNRRFSNGRALGGHMRSHMAKLPIPPKTQQAQELKGPSESAAPSELSFMADSGSAVHDRESETESSRTPARQRFEQAYKSVVEHEPVSSVSDTTPEEDVALCLMMLSRDTWTKAKQEAEEEEEIEKPKVEEEEEEEFSLCRTRTRARTQAMYRCDTCKKLFRSYQALGGHKASHKKIKIQEDAEPSGVGYNGAQHRTYECPYCFKVFESGQALGGHKKIHFSNTATASSSARHGVKLIDLNLPATQDDEDFSQVELSAISDATMHHSMIR